MKVRFAIAAIVAAWAILGAAAPSADAQIFRGRLQLFRKNRLMPFFPPQTVEPQQLVDPVPMKTEPEPAKTPEPGKLPQEVKGGTPKSNLTPKEALEIATDAYIFGYPLVTMEMTRRVMTNVAEPIGLRSPMGQFVLARTYPDAKFRDVTAPNADTLYSSAWLDLSKEPYIFSVPDADNRYYLMPMLDGWTDVVHVPGTRTTGTKAQLYALVGPAGTKAALPDGAKVLPFPTNMLWILGRTYCTGTPEDYKKVHEFQDKLALVPLSAYGKPYTAPKGVVDTSIDMKTPVKDQVNRLDANAYFKMLAKLMKDNPPNSADAPMVAKLARIGIVAGQDFDLAKLDPALADALKQAPKSGQGRIAAQMSKFGKSVNGWEFSDSLGLYGTDYLKRALTTLMGLGANRPQDAIYPVSEKDADGKPYSGANKYVIHFDKGQTPQVKGFWSITMYDAQLFFVDNPLNRYTASSRYPFEFNKDGSLDLYIQHDSPGKEKEANWLPAPKGNFVLMLRMYWPEEVVIDGTWKVPPVKMVGK